MKSYVRAVILLVTVANLMTLHTVESQVTLEQVRDNCYQENTATCEEIISFIEALKRNEVNNDRSALNFYTCIEVDSGVVSPNEPINLENFHKVYPEEDWAEFDPIVTECSSGANLNIEDQSDRLYNILSCVHADKYQKPLIPTISFAPAACQ